MTQEPCFSIGVTTFNRPELLRECVRSLLAQTEHRLEVIIGNDYVRTPVTRETLGLHDARIRIINHSTQIGETANFNALLAAARGTWFSWLADDDYFSPRYLEQARIALDAFPDARIAFASHAEIDETTRGLEIVVRKVAAQPPVAMTGEEFLFRYWQGEIHTLPPAAVFDRKTLVEFGGATQFADWPIALMTEDYLLVQAGTLPLVAYVPETLVYFRLHDTSWSANNTDVQAAEEAGVMFVGRALALLEHPAFKARYATHLRALLWYTMRRIVLPMQRLPGGFDAARQARYAARCLAQLAPHVSAHPVAVLRVVLELTAQITAAAIRISTRVIRRRITHWA